MKTFQIENDIMKAIIIEQLEKFGYRDVEGKTLKELKYKLAAFRAMEVKAESPHSSWF